MSDVLRKLTLELTEDQARAVSRALEVYAAIGLGQLEILGDLVRMGIIPMAKPGEDGERELATPAESSAIEDVLGRAKAILGHPAHGSHSVGSHLVSPSVLRAFETSKVLNQALANQRGPLFGAQGVDNDGLIVRYTDDPAPTAVFVEGCREGA